MGTRGDYATQRDSSASGRQAGTSKCEDTFGRTQTAAKGISKYDSDGAISLARHP
jgi:hypothetical protein